MSKAFTIATNENYLFFLGQKGSQIDRTESHLFIQKKQGAGVYYHYGAADTKKLLNPTALTTYKDEFLLVRNEGFISVLNVSKFPPLTSDFTAHNIEMRSYQPGELGNNSVCSMMAQR